MFLTAAVYDFTFDLEFHRRVPVTGYVVSSAERRRALKLVDRALSKRQYKSAVSLVKQLQGKPYGLRGFGAAKQIIKRRLELDESEVNGMDMLSLQPLVDSILDSVQQCLQISFLEEILSAEKPESSMAEGRHSSRCEEQEHFICAQHEAGHFLVGYLMGVLPKEYQVPSVQALSQNRFAEGKVSFVGFEFLGETLNQFSCVTLGGLVAELLVAGNSDGHLADILKLWSVLTWFGLPKSEADLHLRWAATNTAFIMSRHCETRLRLAEAMTLAKPIGLCIDTIENCLEGAII
ncbi:uncharacterized protein E5676_scaffold16G003430 [Cucumis melo var. makuwa]|uniref:Uncharacterized protein n=1 Tax=Cucumis melo var. makuwa TaxID=1194695 RepID=A0A5D3CG48_CUCMM|nr:uncharacterized protein E5676_scaffold16G003430 [Cucumis melo var. makuwa]